MTNTLESNTVAARPTRVDHSPDASAPGTDLAERRKVYRWFVRGTFLFAAHVLAVLLVLGYVFSDGMG
jgi:hypothetical protein